MSSHAASDTAFEDAGFLRRSVAKLIDWLITMTLSQALVAGLMRVPLDSEQAYDVIIRSFIALYLFYSAMFLAGLGATPAKMMLRLKVVTP